MSCSWCFGALLLGPLPSGEGMSSPPPQAAVALLPGPLAGGEGESSVVVVVACGTGNDDDSGTRSCRVAVQCCSTLSWCTSWSWIPIPPLLQRLNSLTQAGARVKHVGRVEGNKMARSVMVHELSSWRLC